MARRGNTSSPFRRRHLPELRDRAVRLVLETTADPGDRFGMVTRVAGQLSIGPSPSASESTRPRSTGCLRRPDG